MPTRATTHTSCDILISRVKLGHGGAASVWLGQCPSTKRLCAVKRKFNYNNHRSGGSGTQSSCGSSCYSNSPNDTNSPWSSAPRDRENTSPTTTVGGEQYASCHQTFDASYSPLQQQQHQHPTHTAALVDESSEANLLSHIGPHPHLIPMLGAYESRSYQYAVLELMSSDLGRELKEGRVPKDLPTVKYLLHRVLQAIAHVHHTGIAHRDVKPSNVLLRQEQPDSFSVVVPALSDFGSAHGINPLERPGLQYRGTRAYQPPEALMGRLKTERALAADMWAMGCMMVELLTGVCLFPAESAMVALRKQFELLGSSFQSYPKHDLEITVAEQLKTKLGQHLPHLPAEGFDLLARLLALDPNERISADQALCHPFLMDSQTGQPPQMVGWALTDSCTVAAVRRKDLSSVEFISIEQDDATVYTSGQQLGGEEHEFSHHSHNSSGSIHLSVPRHRALYHEHRQALFASACPSTAQRHSCGADSTHTVAAHRLTLSNMRTTALFAEGVSCTRERFQHLTSTPRQSMSGSHHHGGNGSSDGKGSSGGDGVTPPHRPKRLTFEATPQASPFSTAQQKLQLQCNPPEYDEIANRFSLDEAMLVE